MLLEEFRELLQGSGIDVADEHVAQAVARPGLQVEGSAAVGER